MKASLSILTSCLALVLAQDGQEELYCFPEDRLQRGDGNVFIPESKCSWSRLITTVLLDYDRQADPPIECKMPSVYGVGFEIIHVDGVDDVHHSVSIKAVVMLRWRDPRLTFKRVYKDQPLDNRLLKWLWLPRLGSPLLRSFDILEYSGGKQERLTLMAGQNDTLEYRGLALITFSCSMDFSDFPFDHHKCLFEVS